MRIVRVVPFAVALAILAGVYAIDGGAVGAPQVAALEWVRCNDIQECRDACWDSYLRSQNGCHAGDPMNRATCYARSIEARDRCLDGYIINSWNPY